MKTTTSLLFGLLLSSLPTFGSEKPNIVFIFTDDHRADALGCAGNPHLKTPNLDRIATQGTRFENAFVTLSVCSPSRAVALTGRYNSANGVTAIGKGRMNEGEVTFPQLLQHAGYRTAVTGKWHLGDSPKQCGFDFSSTCYSNGTWYGRQFTREDGTKIKAENFVDQFSADEAVRFLRQSSDKPFALWLCTQVPHMDHRHTWPAKKEFLASKKIENMPLPNSWNDGLNGKAPYLAKSRSRTKALAYGYDKAEAIQAHTRDYYASVEQMDQTLGTVLDELDRLGVRDNTWIIMQGDNGWLLGEHGLTSKVLAYEDSIRVPLIIAPPGGSSKTNQDFALGIDIAPTILDIAGLPTPSFMHGRSLLPLVKGNTPSDWRTKFVYEAPQSQLGSEPLWAIRTHDEKYIEYPGLSFEEVYDLKNDPAERKNISPSPESKSYHQTITTHRAQVITTKVATAKPTKKPSFSGIYPHLSFFNDENECGTGAVVPFADRLWAVTYAPHAPTGSTDKLYEIGKDLNMVIREESIGGTPANRMIHRESNQLFIGPYAIDQNRKVRAIPFSKMFGRPTGNARHLTDPANKIYYASMEEGIYEVDVNTLDVKTLFFDEAKKGSPKTGLHGYHGKGFYSGQGRIIYSNNGQRGKDAKTNPFTKSGVLAQWDGKAKNFETVLEKQFTEVTGPNGIYGSENPATDAIWANGWDARSLILMCLHEGEWHRYRLPKASHSYDGAHGWNTEWPRIREIGEGDNFLMTMHGMFWNFPKTFTPKTSAGISPRSTYLKVIGDFARWGDHVVMGCDDTAHAEFLNKRKAKGHVAAPQSQSNLWFVKPDQLDHFGPVIGRGSVWLNDKIEANTASDPYLFSGFQSRAAHLFASAPTTFTFEVDLKGDNNWTKFSEVKVDGYHWHAFPADSQGTWIRVTSSASLEKASAWFTYANPDTRELGKNHSKFDGLAKASDKNTTSGIVRARDKNKRDLHFASEKGLYQLNPDMTLVKVDDANAESWLKKNAAIPKHKGILEVDKASVIYIDDTGRRFRLPKGHSDLDNETGRISREVATERDLFNAHGTFYELPANNALGFPRVRPVATHNLRIQDFCSYRGLLILSGVSNNAPKDNHHLIHSTDGKTALWAGAVDDLWKLGKPVGQGGPWLDTKVKAKSPSDPFLMTGYDNKTLTLRSSTPTKITIEVDITGNGDWKTYQTLDLKEEFTHQFPANFQAYWIRFISRNDTTATAQLVYR
ncbi:MAG: sulfatase-like hydrolase/transferase [Akkermansiaceae bacterium]